MYVFLWRINKILINLYHKYLESNRKLSKFKCEIEDQNNENKAFTTYSRNSIFAFKILKLGLFTSDEEERNLDGSNNDNEVEVMLRKKNRSSISFFKVPELYIDYLRRINANSFRLFLNSIYESEVHFIEYKLSSEQYYMDVSTRIDLLNRKYIEYCTKEGLRPRLIEKEKELLNEFNLELEFKSDSSTDSYTNIKWKTVDEKLLNDEVNAIDSFNSNHSSIGNVENSVIKFFLEAECSKSSFKSDFILVSDLNEKYNKFCINHKIPEISKLKIIGSPELKDFGSEFNPRFVVPYVKGISLKRVSGQKSQTYKNDSSYLEDIIRIPKELSYKTAKIGCCVKMKRKFSYFALSEEGIITNFSIVIIHLAIIIGIPLLILLAATWTLIQIDTVNQDIYAYVFKFKDIFNSSSYNFWFDHMTGKAYFFTVAGLGCFFFISGLFELICYYATGARDTGKYIVTKTWPRWIISTTFWIIIIVFIGIYTAYISMMLVWCILGAILNPQKFLPMAAGAVVVIGFCTMIYSKLKQIDDTLKEAVSTTINLALKNSINENFEKKEKLKLTQLVMKPLAGFTQRMFYMAVNASVKEFNLPPIEKELTDSVLEGDAGAVALLFNKTCGVDKNISLCLIGLLLNDQTLILNSIYNLSEEIGFDGELSVAISEIAINSYNNSSVDIKQVEYSVILSVKKLFRKLMPDFPQDIIDPILQVALEADPNPLKKLCEKMNVSENVFDLLTALITNNYSKVDDSLYKLSLEIVPSQYTNLFMLLYAITKGDFRISFDILAESFGLNGLSSLIKIVMAAAKKDPELIKEALYNFDDSLQSIGKIFGVDVNIENAIELKNHLLVIHQMICGDDFKIKELVAKFIPDIDPSQINTLHLALTKNRKCFEKIVDTLGLNIQKSKIIEFYSIIVNEYSSLSAIGQQLGIYEDRIDVLRSL